MKIQTISPDSRSAFWKNKPGYKPMLFIAAAVVFIIMVVMPSPRSMIDMVTKVSPPGYELAKGCSTIVETVNKKLRSKAFEASRQGKAVEGEKPLMDEYINVGFMVLEKEVFQYIHPDEDVMFEETLQKIADDGKLGYYIHDGFWHAMDSYKDYEELNQMWREDPKWKIWDE